MSEFPSIPRSLDLTQAVSRPTALIMSAVNTSERHPGPFPGYILTSATPDHESFNAAPERAYVESLFNSRQILLRAPSTVLSGWPRTV